MEMEKNSLMKDELVCLQEISLRMFPKVLMRIPWGRIPKERHGSLECSTRTRDTHWPDGIVSGTRTVLEPRNASFALMALAGRPNRDSCLMCSVNVLSGANFLPRLNLSFPNTLLPVLVGGLNEVPGKGRALSSRGTQ